MLTNINGVFDNYMLSWLENRNGFSSQNFVKFSISIRELNELEKWDISNYMLLDFVSRETKPYILRILYILWIENENKGWQLALLSNFIWIWTFTWIVEMCQIFFFCNDLLKWFNCWKCSFRQIRSKMNYGHLSGKSIFNILSVLTVFNCYSRVLFCVN